jgi:ketosteroid isomerase-like protein
MNPIQANLARIALLVLTFPVWSLAQGGTIEPSAREGIAAGNQSWIEGMKRGDAKLISATYAADALDCGSTGECLNGRPAIERQLQDRIDKLGRAVSAAVRSGGSVQQGDFVYEWGEAEASFANGNRILGRYLTVWRKQNNRWLIFRNIKIPNDAAAGGR